MQTAGTGVTGQTTPQGNMAGHGISVNQSHCASYRAQEFGVVIGLMSVMPRTAYQQGINRQWLRQTKFDFYFLIRQSFRTGYRGGRDIRICYAR